MVRVLVKHKRQIGRIHLCLLFSWTIEVLLWLAYTIVSLMSMMPPIRVYAALVALKVFRAVNFIFFLAIIFRLKAVTIYMQEESNSEDKIKVKLQRLKEFRTWLCFFYGVSFLPF